MSSELTPVRQPLNMPAGSVRSLLVLMIVLIASVIILTAHETTREPRFLPPYLMYLLFMALGAYFSGHGTSYSQKDSNDPSPLYLPRGTVPVLVLAALSASIGYMIFWDYDAVKGLLTNSLDRIKEQPFLPIIILAGFFLGLVARFIFGRNPRAFWAQDIQAWIAMIALILMTADVLLQLVIGLSLRDITFDLRSWEAFLAAIIAFYFGSRS